MDSSTIWIIVIVVAVLAFFFFRRGRTAPQGTYDDKDVRSSGSIGGGPRAHDNENVRSGGSIGGGPSSTDSRDVRSSGSIGGDPSVVNRDPRTDMRNETRTGVRENDTMERQNRIAEDQAEGRRSGLSRVANERTNTGNQTTNSEDRLVQLRADRTRRNPNNVDSDEEDPSDIPPGDPRYNDRKLKSGGSFGSS